jgi:hypothetical protein
MQDQNAPLSINVVTVCEALVIVMVTMVIAMLLTQGNEHADRGNSGINSSSKQ